MWTKAYGPALSLPIYRKLASIFCTRIADSRLRADLEDAYEKFLRGEQQRLLSFKIDYDAQSIADVISARQVLALFQKNTEFVLDEKELEKAAYAKFRAAEAQCLSTDTRFYADVPATDKPHLISALFKAQRLMARMLGPCPTIDKLPLRFGPGSTVTVDKQHGTVQAKLADAPSCSQALAHSPRLPEFLRSLPHWLDCHQEEEYVDDEGYLVARLNLKVQPSELQFVPKKVDSLRSIIKQPTLNTMLQCGIGDYMVGRLKAFGVDLSDQTIQQKRARKGSIDGSLATLDLSSASDTISYWLG